MPTHTSGTAEAVGPGADRSELSPVAANGTTAIPIIDILDERMGGALARDIASRYLNDFRKLMERMDTAAIAGVVDRLRAARNAGATIFIAGNGGSASTATHWANDLGKATKASGGQPIRVMSLSDNTSWLTALANDEGYERVFSGQLENFARPGDVLIVISASGNSPNVVRAVEMAQASGMWTIGLLGFDGGQLHGRLDSELWVETAPGAYGLVETAHVLLADIVTSCLISDGAANP